MPVIKKRVAPLDKQGEFESRRYVMFIFRHNYVHGIIIVTNRVYFYLFSDFGEM